MRVFGIWLTCLIVDDSTEFVAAATRLLEAEGIRIVGSASTACDAIKWARDLRPDVALVDIGLGGEDGFDVAELLASLAYAPAVILISGDLPDRFADRIAAGSALGFIPKIELSRQEVERTLDLGRRRSR
jgi:DNA-binding NarL/FixJ family response regulator